MHSYTWVVTMRSPSLQSSIHASSRPLPKHLCFRAPSGETRRHLCRKRGGIRSAGEGGSKGSSGISDDVLQRLRLAEEEAVKLREELAKAKAEALERVSSKKYFAVKVLHYATLPYLLTRDHR